MPVELPKLRPGPGRHLAEPDQRPGGRPGGPGRVGEPAGPLHLIDLIYRQDAGSRPEVIIGDTGSYSDMVFGILRSLGFDYRPQLADLPDTKLWRINPAAHYGPLRTAARAGSTSKGSDGSGRTSCGWLPPSTPAP